MMVLGVASWLGWAEPIRTVRVRAAEVVLVVLGGQQQQTTAHLRMGEVTAVTGVRVRRKMGAVGMRILRVRVRTRIIIVRVMRHES